MPSVFASNENPNENTDAKNRAVDLRTDNRITKSNRCSTDGVIASAYREWDPVRRGLLAASRPRLSSLQDGRGPPPLRRGPRPCPRPLRTA